MKLKILFQALRFACLPTLSVLVLLLFGFFSISKTIEFISSDNGWSITIRMFLVIAEIILIWCMYEHYLEEDIKNNTSSYTKDNKGVKISEYIEIKNLFNGVDSDSKFVKHYTGLSNIIIIQKN